MRVPPSASPRFSVVRVNVASHFKTDTKYKKQLSSEDYLKFIVNTTEVAKKFEEEANRDPLILENPDWDVEMTLTRNYPDVVDYKRKHSTVLGEEIDIDIMRSEDPYLPTFLSVVSQPYDRSPTALEKFIAHNIPFSIRRFIPQKSRPPEEPIHQLLNRAFIQAKEALRKATYLHDLNQQLKALVEKPEYKEVSAKALIDDDAFRLSMKDVYGRTHIETLSREVGRKKGKKETQPESIADLYLRGLTALETTRELIQQQRQLKEGYSELSLLPEARENPPLD